MRIGMKGIIVAAFIATLTVTSLIAQDPNDPLTKGRKTAKETARIYQNWLSKDVRYIITKEEKRAFKALKTDDERENFIENFWRRNPSVREGRINEQQRRTLERLYHQQGRLSRILKELKQAIYGN